MLFLEVMGQVRSTRPGSSKPELMGKQTDDTRVFNVAKSFIRANMDLLGLGENEFQKLKWRKQHFPASDIVTGEFTQPRKGYESVI